MEQGKEHDHPQEVAAAFDRDMRGLAVRDTPHERAVLRTYSKALKKANPELVLATARILISKAGYRPWAYELIANHPAAFQNLDAAALEELGAGIDSWWAVDTFARILSGPAWLRGQVNDDTIAGWAHSPDRWWRRAALVSTVALNMRSHGGLGDVPRTLAVCRLLVADRDDMVVKALSWALRELVVHDAAAVERFLGEYEQGLAGRVKREVRSKLETGLKNPRRGKKS
jgi:3-methyladenine DNA glycosylase AlkD